MIIIVLVNQSELFLISWIFLNRPYMYQFPGFWVFVYLLTALLTYHVTEEVLYSGGLKDGQEVPTVEKSKLVISINGNHTQIIQTLSSLLENGLCLQW